jgi:hypothetical protein
LIIHGITQEMFEEIEDKYLKFKCTLSNMTFSNSNGVEVFNSVETFLNKWIDMRLNVYKLRKNAQL